ncbi:MAG: histidine-type phosphatase, partial [Alistipes sp.]|nr:histidine-type phosphatase [Alistipes sp.]
MRRLLFTALAIVVAITATAQTAREKIMADKSYAMGVYRLYPTQFKPQTPAPKGYKPFYISHYGR